MLTGCIISRSIRSLVEFVICTIVNKALYKVNIVDTTNWNIILIEKAKILFPQLIPLHISVVLFVVVISLLTSVVGKMVGGSNVVCERIDTLIE